MDNKALMVDSDEIEYWDGEEVGDTEEIYMAEDIPNNIQSSNSPAIQSYYDEKSILNYFSLYHQGGDAASSSSNSRLPLGLRLGNIPSLLNSLQTSMSKVKDEKIQATNFPASSIKIGNWERLSSREGDLTVKLYYMNRKLVWELLEGALKYKIEMKWSDISAIMAITHEGILQVELNKPPLCFQEVYPQPKKHTNWEQTPDFTSGEASVWRKHIVNCQAGFLDKHYAKLLQCDRRLFDLSQQPFPTGKHKFRQNF